MTEMSREQMIALLTEQKALIEKLAAQAQANGKYNLRLKVSEKGGASLYGMGQWPVTLYKQQWLALLDHADTIRAFLKTNDALLSDKAKG